MRSLHPFASKLSAERRRVRLLVNALNDTGDDQHDERAGVSRTCILATGQGVRTRLEPQR